MDPRLVWSNEIIAENLSNLFLKCLSCGAVKHFVPTLLRSNAVKRPKCCQRGKFGVYYDNQKVGTFNGRFWQFGRNRKQTTDLFIDLIYYKLSQLMESSNVKVEGVLIGEGEDELRIFDVRSREVLVIPPSVLEGTFVTEPRKYQNGKVRKVFLLTFSSTLDLEYRKLRYEEVGIVEGRMFFEGVELRRTPKAAEFYDVRSKKVCWLPHSTYSTSLYSFGERTPSNLLTQLVVIKPSFMKAVSFTVPTTEQHRFIHGPPLKRRHILGMIVFETQAIANFTADLVWDVENHQLGWVTNYIEREVVAQSFFNGKPIYRFELRPSVQITILWERTSDLIPEFFFDTNLHLKRLRRRTLRSKLLEMIRQRRQDLEEGRPLALSPKAILQTLGLTGVQDSSYCVACRGDLRLADNIICQDCVSILEHLHNPTESQVNVLKFLPAGLPQDPLEIRFEDIGVKCHRRRYKWHSKKKK